MTVHLALLDDIQRAENGVEIFGNVVQPLPKALILAAVVGYDRTFLSSTTPSISADWGFMEWNSIGVLAGGQPFFSWTHQLMVWLLYGNAPANPVPGGWLVNGYHDVGVAALFQAPNAQVLPDAAQASDTIPGFLGSGGGPTADHLTLTLSRTPRANSAVIAVNGSADNGSTWAISDPTGYINLLAADSNTSSPDPDYAAFTHTHLDVSVAASPGDTLTWDVADGATVGGLALEIVPTTRPRLRQFPRDDALGGAPRQAGLSRSVQATQRQGWSGTYR